MKITVERCDKIMVAVSQIFNRVKSVALWSANIRKLAKDHKGYGSAANQPMAMNMNPYFGFRKAVNFKSVFLHYSNVVLRIKVKTYK